jgi:8-oxo-dGTP pyrophosphatase MutT (NUDIX family)
MEKFTKIRIAKKPAKKRSETLYSDNYVKLISYEDWSMVVEKDLVIVLPYLIESNELILRYEYIPTYKYVEGQEYHITMLSGGIEEGETSIEAAIRELEEEAGIVLKDEKKLQQLKPVFVSKVNCNKYHMFFLPLHERDYYQVSPTGDGSKAESKSTCIKINYKNIDTVNCSDLITEYMLLKSKELI